ncbi:hypothetical protein BD779DRAFT_628056 [Infundibulicybe gibba]|nr:hypothetical protein BD779DRAFT_628056 [Infundibulicybe gibba]
MRELLPEALSALKGATTVIWTMRHKDPDWTSVLVSEFLGTLPALDTLDLVVNLEQPKVHLNRASNLTKLTVKSISGASAAEINPHLTHLDVLAFDCWPLDDTTTLHNVLEKVPRGRPLRLEHLCISGYCVRLDHETLPHLRRLRSLELNAIFRIPDGIKWCYENNPFGSSPRDLWRVVGRAGIPLEAVVAPASDSVIDYLSSRSLTTPDLLLLAVPGAVIVALVVLATAHRHTAHTPADPVASFRTGIPQSLQLSRMSSGHGRGRTVASSTFYNSECWSLFSCTLCTLASFGCECYFNPRCIQQSQY